VSALSTALQQVISSIAVAGLSTVLSSRTTTHVGEVRAGLAAHPPQGAHAGVSQAVQTALGRAAATAFDDTFHVVAAITVVSALIGLLLRRSTVESPVVEESSATQ